MRKTENKASCEGQPPTLIWTLWYWFNRENRSRWIMMSWLNALLASVTEGGWEWGVGCGGRDGRKEWRTVSERVMQAVRDKANELDVNPGEFFQNTGCLKQPRAFINVFCSLFVDNSVRLHAVAAVYSQTLLAHPAKLGDQSLGCSPVPLRWLLVVTNPGSPFKRGFTKRRRRQEVAASSDCSSTDQHACS